MELGNRLNYTRCLVPVWMSGCRDRMDLPIGGNWKGGNGERMSFCEIERVSDTFTVFRCVKVDSDVCCMRGY